MGSRFGDGAGLQRVSGRDSNEPKITYANRHRYDLASPRDACGDPRSAPGQEHAADSRKVARQGSGLRRKPPHNPAKPRTAFPRVSHCLGDPRPGQLLVLDGSGRVDAGPRDERIDGIRAAPWLPIICGRSCRPKHCGCSVRTSGTPRRFSPARSWGAGRTGRPSSRRGWSSRRRTSRPMCRKPSTRR